ncbi:MAG: GGDEF domain-containing protein, partial [Gallionellaceae bacterium]|nr:GGDEF domain-containing protein [Gallionellaceae bacterium]
AINRFGLMGRLDEVASRSQRFAHPMAVLLLDLDHFKDINDRHGHPVGDEVLKGFVEVLRQNVRASDILGRWGGEEFLVISPHLGLDSAVKLAEKLRLSIEAASFTAGIRLTASIGVAEFVPGEKVSELVERVDRALYAAKADGRNRVAATGWPLREWRPAATCSR